MTDLKGKLTLEFDNGTEKTFKVLISKLRIKNNYERVLYSPLYADENTPRFFDGTPGEDIFIGKDGEFAGYIIGEEEK
jgi:hypothetical protein